uniref:Protein kinase domain-containing protein n=1 Tax=Oryzias latipes TaxID=8090 RepID=A0A3P9KF63_ORYLA
MAKGGGCMYFVERFLGEGTFGKVAKCTNLSTNEEVAIKIIKNGFNDTAKDEIKALTEISKLDAHKYSLVKFVEWFHFNSHVCIVFEMLDHSLFDFMKDRSSLPLFLREIRAIAWQLLISLKGLKSINLVHCDIKLDNIMLVNQVSEPFRVKLIDFGLASKTTDIQTGTRLQNICFRAPEVILGLPLDERLDMWTVGYVLALLYTGFYILPRDSEYNIIRSKKTGELQLIDLLKRMLEVDPNKRISPNDALRHPFFKLEKKTPKTSEPQEPAAVEVHQQPAAKEVPSVPQGPPANRQETSNNKNKKSLVQQQKAEKRKGPAASRKRTNSDRQNQDPEKSWQMEAAFKVLFQFLGVLLTSELRLKSEIDGRINAASAVLPSLCRSVVVKREPYTLLERTNHISPDKNDGLRLSGKAPQLKPNLNADINHHIYFLTAYI